MAMGDNADYMRSYDSPSKVINMVKALYNDFSLMCCSRWRGHNGVVQDQDWSKAGLQLTCNQALCSFCSVKHSKIRPGRRLGCKMSGLPLVVDLVMRHTLQEGNTGRRWKFTTKFEELDFAGSLSRFIAIFWRFSSNQLSLSIFRICREGKPGSTKTAKMAINRLGDPTGKKKHTTKVR